MSFFYKKDIKSPIIRHPLAVCRVNNRLKADYLGSYARSDKLLETAGTVLALFFTQPYSRESAGTLVSGPGGINHLLC
jgi:hypothetical protein